MGPSPVQAPTKARFDNIDTAAMVNELKITAVNNKVVNIYDLDFDHVEGIGQSSGGKKILIRMNRSTATTSGPLVSSDIDPYDPSAQKRSLLIESGIRFNTSIVSHDQSVVAGGDTSTSSKSTLVTLLRKHLKNTHLISIKQLGNLDRVVDFTFAGNAGEKHLIWEGYGGGNLVLTDVSYRILGVERVHEYYVTPRADSESSDTTTATPNPPLPKPAKEKVVVAIGRIYPVTLSTTWSVQKSLESSEGDSSSSSSPLPPSFVDMEVLEATAMINALLPSSSSSSSSSSSTSTTFTTKKKKANPTLKEIILRNPGKFNLNHFGSSLIHHCLLNSSIEPTEKLSPNSPPFTNEQVGNMQIQFKLADSDILDKFSPSISPSPSLNPGYLIRNEVSNINVSFEPHLLSQYASTPSTQFNTFSEAVDTFYTNLSSQRMKLKSLQFETNAAQKIEKIKNDQKKRITDLEVGVDDARRKAELIEINSEQVDKAIVIVNSALDSGMEWDTLGELIDFEQRVNNNPIALLIVGMELEDNKIILELPDSGENEDEDEDEGERAKRSERALMKTRILAINPAKWLQTLLNSHYSTQFYDSLHSFCSRFIQNALRSAQVPKFPSTCH